MRAGLRALGWVISELIPAQAVRCALGRDYSRAVTAAGRVWDDAEALAEAEEQQEVLEPRCDDQRCPVLSAPVGYPCPIECVQSSPSAVGESPTPQGDTSGGEVSDPPTLPSPPPLSWSDWAVPAILTELDRHRIYAGVQACSCYYDGLNAAERMKARHMDFDGWMEHTAEAIAARLERATLTEFPKQRKEDQ